MIRFVRGRANVHPAWCPMRRPRCGQNVHTGLAGKWAAGGDPSTTSSRGPIDTDLNRGDWATPQIANTALKRYGHVDDIAAIVAFVAGPEASYITGANLTVDGGTNACVRFLSRRSFVTRASGPCWFLAKAASLNFDDRQARAEARVTNNLYQDRRLRRAVTSHIVRRKLRFVFAPESIELLPGHICVSLTRKRCDDQAVCECTQRGGGR